MLDGIVDVLSVGASIAGGGLFGLIGSGISSIFKIFQRKQEFEEEKQRREWDREDFKLQMQFNQQETENEIAVTSSQGAWQGLNASINAASNIKGSSWDAKLLRMFRPVLTAALVGGSLYIINMMWQSLTGANNALTVIFTEVEIKEVISYSIYSFLFATNTAIVWWFGDRAMTPPHAKGR